jgi:hypothetical protein
MGGNSRRIQRYIRMPQAFQHLPSALLCFSLGLIQGVRLVQPEVREGQRRRATCRRWDVRRDGRPTGRESHWRRRDHWSHCSGSHLRKSCSGLRSTLMMIKTSMIFVVKLERTLEPTCFVLVACSLWGSPSGLSPVDCDYISRSRETPSTSKPSHRTPGSLYDPLCAILQRQLAMGDAGEYGRRCHPAHRVTTVAVRFRWDAREVFTPSVDPIVSHSAIES